MTKPLPRNPRLDPRIGDIVALGGTEVMVIGFRADGWVMVAVGAPDFVGSFETGIEAWRALFNSAEVVRAV